LQRLVRRPHRQNAARRCRRRRPYPNERAAYSRSLCQSVGLRTGAAARDCLARPLDVNSAADASHQVLAFLLIDSRGRHRAADLRYRRTSGTRHRGAMKITLTFPARRRRQADAPRKPTGSRRCA
jgi:hypothetical protein